MAELGKVSDAKSARTFPSAGRQWRVASEQYRRSMATAWLASSLKDRASSRLRLMENAHSLRRAAPREKSINSYLENGHPIRYSGRMSTHCDAAAPTRRPPGEAHSLPAPAPLVTTFAAGPLSVNSVSEVASRRLAAHAMGTRRPLSSPLSLSATPQLQPAQPLSTCVAQNASGDTRRHTTHSPRLGSRPLRGWPRLASSPTWAAQPQENQSLLLSSPTPQAATPQLQPAQQVRFRVAQNASGDTTHQATPRDTRQYRLGSAPCHCRSATTRCLPCVAVSASCRPAHRPELPGSKQLVTCVAENANRDRDHVEARHDQSQTTTS
jgi:hypothetical protein